jgi:protein-disulfide isomerase
MTSSGLLRYLFPALTAAAFAVPLPTSFCQENNPQKPVATVQGVPITQQELNAAAAADLEKLEMQRSQLESQLAMAKQQILQTNLRRLIDDRILTAEAAKRGVSKQDLIASEIAAKASEPTPQEIDNYYESNKARIPVPKEQAAGQIQQFLKQQNYIKAQDAFLEPLRKSYTAMPDLEPLRYPIETKGHAMKGKDSAPVTLVEFSDFQCSYCQLFSSTLGRIVTDYGDMVRLVYRHFPVSTLHPDAQKAAEAAICAQEQGHFWEMHDLLFQDSNKLKADDLKADAAKIGLDTKAFAACLDSGKYLDRLKRDVLDASKAGVNGTPALFINGRPLPGAVPYEEIAKLIDEELKKIYPTGQRKQ